MGKVNFIPLQKSIIDILTKQKEFVSRFYFTGGTALSVFYFNHRYSEDLDFFSEQDFDDNVVLRLADTVSQSLNLRLRHTKRDIARIFEFLEDDKVIIKVDFVYQRYKRIEKGKTEKNLDIDSLIDIGANKLLTINQRTDVKDFVDLYFLLKQYTLWDIMYAKETKFRLETDLMLLGMDFMKINDFTVLPKMIKPLTLDQLKKFFRHKAKEVGEKAVEK